MPRYPSHASAVLDNTFAEGSSRFATTLAVAYGYYPPTFELAITFLLLSWNCERGVQLSALEGRCKKRPCLSSARSCLHTKSLDAKPMVLKRFVWPPQFLS
eukprot:1938234-Pleurochrysis_carterae.AAC.1